MTQQYYQGAWEAQRRSIQHATRGLPRLLVEVEGPIVEHNYWADRFWGADLQGVGANNLGKILMAQRDHLINVGVKPPTYSQRELEQRAQWREADQENVWFPEEYA